MWGIFLCVFVLNFLLCFVLIAHFLGTASFSQKDTLFFLCFYHFFPLFGRNLSLWSNMKLFLLSVDSNMNNVHWLGEKLMRNEENDRKQDKSKQNYIFSSVSSLQVPSTWYIDTVRWKHRRALKLYKASWCLVVLNWSHTLIYTLDTLFRTGAICFAAAAAAAWKFCCCCSLVQR